MTKETQIPYSQTDEYYSELATALAEAAGPEEIELILCKDEYYQGGWG